MLRRVEKPARYTGGETNIIKKDPSAVDLRMGFAFPDVYEIGMSYLGLQILYNIMNREEGVAFERIFAPAVDMEELMRKENRKLFTLESYTPVDELDIVGFTLQYEMSFTNILNMLDLSGIPIRRAHRFAQAESNQAGSLAGDLPDQSGNWPIVIAGGPCAFNPEPLADFIDCFLIGDGEELLPEICRELIHIKKKYPESKGKITHDMKLEFLRKIASIDGVYVPMFYEPEYGRDGLIKEMKVIDEAAPAKVNRALVADIGKVAFPKNNLVPIIDAVHDRSVVETFRGCTRGCRFCQAGMIYRPVRERKKEDIISIAMEQIHNTGHDELSLLSLSTSDYSNFEPMATELMGLCKSRNVALSLPSLRLDSFSFNVLQEIQGYRKSGLTFAPEAGTQRLRDVINKNITEEDIFSATRQAIELGWEHIKLYFMIGLPTETDEDLDGIARIAKKIVDINYEIRGRKGGRFRVTVSVSNFVPKAHTPFQWVAQDTPEEFIRKHDYLSNKLRIKGVTFNYHESNTSSIEAVFARGDRRCGDVLEEAWRRGCKFDSWSEHFKEDVWMEAFEASGLDPDFYTVRPRDFREVLPWDHIDSFVDRSFLRDEYEKATAAQVTPDCREGCAGCGMNRHTDCFVNCGAASESSAYETPRDPGVESSTLEMPGESGINKVESPAGDPNKYVMKFSKQGTICYSSHLDLMRVFKRAFKIAGIALVHSQGFNPHPKMGFAQPLSLGYWSLCEFIEFETKENLDPEEILIKMSSLLPEGIDLLECERATGYKKTLASHTVAAEYMIEIPLKGELNRFMDAGEESVHDKLYSDYMNREEITAYKRQKKSKELKLVDIKPMIRDISFHLSEKTMYIKTLLDSGSSSNLSPELVISSVLELFKIETHRSEISVVRKNLIFDIDKYSQ